MIMGTVRSRSTVQNVQKNTGERSKNTEDQSRDAKDQSRDVEDQSRADAEDNVTDDNRSTEHDSRHNYSTYLANFPTELLVKILSYLPTRDRFMMRNVSQRFRDVSEMPLLWKECIWNYEPRHVSSVSKVLIEHGEHMRRIFFPAHLTVKIVHEWQAIVHK